ncbi:MAG: IPT/TIG domain-containing protein [Bryobacteraceae bacterium]
MSWSTFGQTYTINTVAGNVPAGHSLYGGDGGPAVSAQLASPLGVALDSSGNLYIADTDNQRIRKVSNGVITTVAGNGPAGFYGDNGPATSAWLNNPAGVVLDSAGNLYIADTNNQRIRKVSNGMITTVAGNGTLGFSGDNGPATNAMLNQPTGVALDSAGNLYIADSHNNRIRKVSNGVIATVAGIGTNGYSGDGGPATSAQLSFPAGLAVDSAGNLYIADTFNGRIRKVSNGVITTVAGGGFYGDNGPATSAQLNYPEGVAVDSAGNLYIAASDRIRKVSNGVIITVAGGGGGSCCGDGGPAINAELYAPTGVVVDSAGDIYIADRGNNRIRILTPSPCAYSVSPTTLQAPASGGLVTTTVRTDTSCFWTVSGLPGWIGLWAASGAGSDNVILAVARNCGTAQTATVSIAGVSVTITQPAAATVALPLIAAVTNAASYATGSVSPGELITIFGSNIGPDPAAGATTDPATGKLATTICGVQVLFNGIAAPIIYASSTQVSAVVPYEMATVGSPGVWLKYAGGTSNAFQLTTAATAPGLFTQNASGSGPGSILNQDGVTLNAPAHPAAKGSIVTLYLTGEGLTIPASVTGAFTTATLPPPQVTPAPASLPIAVLINGQPAPYVYAGEAPGFVAGLMQLNVQIPSTAPTGALQILVSIGGRTSENGVTVSVQ